MAATTASGHEPKTPPKKRHIRTVCRSLPTATATWKMVKPNMATIRGSFLPLSSDNGAHRMGPVANPRTYNDNPNRPTSVDTPKTAATSPVAAENRLLAKAETSVVYPRMTLRDTLVGGQQSGSKECRPILNSLFLHWPILRMQRIIGTIEFNDVVFLSWQ